MKHKIKNIIIITQDYAPSSDGISTWCREFSKELIHNQFKVIVITKSYEGNTCPLNTPINEMDDIPVIRLDHNKWKSTKYRKLLFCILPLVEEETLFLCSNWKMGIPCRLIALVKKIDYMVAVHGLDAITKRQLQAIQQKSVLYHSIGFFTVSKYTMSLLNQIDKKKVPFTIINNGVDTNRFKVEETSPEFMKKYGLKPGKKILSLARLIPRKGFDMTIKAISLMETKDVDYYIAGTGPYENELKKLAIEHNLNDRIHFLGYIPEEDICPLYNSADVYCMPSRNHKGNVEGFGITYIEAGACEVPSIGGENSGAEDAIINGVTGALVNPESPEEIAKELDSLLKNPEIMREMGKTSRERIINEFTWEKIVGSFIEFASECISTSHKYKYY